MFRSFIERGWVVKIGLYKAWWLLRKFCYDDLNVFALDTLGAAFVAQTSGYGIERISGGGKNDLVESLVAKSRGP